MDTNEQKDEALWKIAKKRAAFKLSATAYVVINVFLVGVWYYTTGLDSYFWPIWSIFGWGLGIVFHYIDAYMTAGFFSEQREYEELKKRKREGGLKK